VGEECYVDDQQGYDKHHLTKETTMEARGVEVATRIIANRDEWSCIDKILKVTKRLSLAPTHVHISVADLVFDPKTEAT
jgi:hypothetical protein